MWLLCIFALGAAVSAGTPHNKDTNVQAYKDQYCTDPRTMRKHAAYTEWADAYSCTRHRCQPGGRNLAIYTVGCKRVEAPESAIECEEVVEDTNMQFPFCCTRLRCLVVVRGEVWTRVLGQPWEVLPAAPWSHMYKMKKPPPADSTFSPKIVEAGPVYELSEPESSEPAASQKQRSGRKVATTTTDIPDYANDVVPRSNAPAVPTPDIVIALTTNNDKESSKKSGGLRILENAQSAINWHNQPHSDSDSDTEHKSARKSHESPNIFEKDDDKERHEPEMQELDEVAAPASEKPPEGSEEKFFENNAFSQKEKHKAMNSHHQAAWTDIPQNQWSEHEGMDVDNRPNNVMELHYTQEPPRKTEFQAETERTERKPEKGEKSNNLQSLVDAIGTRMRDIENVVHKMSEKVHQKLPAEISAEKRGLVMDVDYGKHHKNGEVKESSSGKRDRDSDDEHSKPRSFSMRTRGSKYLHGASDATSEHPLYIEDSNNYFNDASNNVRRSSPKEPASSAPTYMAPVENRHKPSARIPVANDVNDEQEKKKKKHGHKKRRGKVHSHKKHRQDKRKHFNKLSSVEINKNVVTSIEDSSAVVN